MDENQIGTIIVDCAVKLHRALGSGLLERENYQWTTLSNNLGASVSP